MFISYHNYIKWWISDIFQHLLCEIADLAEKESIASTRPVDMIEVIREEEEDEEVEESKFADLLNMYEKQYGIPC